MTPENLSALISAVTDVSSIRDCLGKVAPGFLRGVRRGSSYDGFQYVIERARETNVQGALFNRVCQIAAPLSMTACLIVIRLVSQPGVKLLVLSAGSHDIFTIKELMHWAIERLDPGAMESGRLRFGTTPLYPENRVLYNGGDVHFRGVGDDYYQQYDGIIVLEGGDTSFTQGGEQAEYSLQKDGSRILVDWPPSEPLVEVLTKVIPSYREVPVMMTINDTRLPYKYAQMVLREREVHRERKWLLEVLWRGGCKDRSLLQYVITFL